MPRYENNEDLRREELIAQETATLWRADQRKSTDKSFDRVYSKDGFDVAVAEIKCRRVESTLRSTYMIDSQKIESILRHSQERGIPGVLIVGFTDGICWVTAAPGMLADVRTGGRSDRGDASDVDLCCFIPITLFTRVSDLNVWG